MLQASERIHYQYWLRSDITVIPDIDLSENGWIIVEGHVQPVCFVGKGSSPNFGAFWGFSRMGRVDKKSLPPPPPKNLSYISCNDEAWHSYTLLEEDPKTI